MQKGAEGNIANEWVQNFSYARINSSNLLYDTVPINHSTILYSLESVKRVDFMLGILTTVK